MPDTFKFPKGYEVRVLRKKDILACIDNNIIDKDVALAVISQCEVDATNFIKEGRWTGIPYIGNIRIPRGKQILNLPETQELLEEAKNNLDEDKFILFRRRLGEDIRERIKREKYFNYTLSKMVTKNFKLFNRTRDRKGKLFAKIFLFVLNTVELCDEYTKWYGK